MINEYNGDDLQAVETANRDQVTTRAQALIIRRDYVCSACWGHLTYRQVDSEHDMVICAQYPDEHSGFVSKTWVERQRQVDAESAVDARSLLRKIGVISNPHKGKSDKQLLHELGF